MDVPRVRFGAVLEWVVAAGLLIAGAGLASKALLELRSVPAVTPVIAESRPVPEAPAAISPGSVLVPMLLLSSGTELRIGQTAIDIGSGLNSAWQVGAETIERQSDGERLIRRYDDGSTRFSLVLQPAEGRNQRIVAIYVGT